MGVPNKDERLICNDLDVNLYLSEMNSPHNLIDYISFVDPITFKGPLTITLLDHNPFQ